MSKTTRILFLITLFAGLAVPFGRGQTLQAAAAGDHISAGLGHTCVITAAGGVKCWGWNSRGQLGDGSYTGSHVPVDVVGLGSNVVAVNAGTVHTCALTTAGGLKCWGFNLFGTLGAGNNIDSNVPLDVVGLDTDVAAVSSGDGHTCALTMAGAVKCWGSNTQGQLGNGTNANSNVPLDVAGLDSGIVAITTGYNHSCALTAAGGVKCWGRNAEGQLGNGNNNASNVPVDVSGLDSGITAINAGRDHTCALTAAGGVKCWGYNIVGGLGNGQNVNSNVPVDVTGLDSGIAAVGGGDFHTCALTTAGGVKCWGYNAYGQLGEGSNNNSNVPVDVSGLDSGMVAVAVGAFHTCALTAHGGAKCWGRNDLDQLGNDTGQHSSVPLDVAGLGPQYRVEVAAGGHCGSGAGGTMNLVIEGAGGDSLNLSATSSDESVVPAGNVHFGGSGANRTVTIAAVPKNQVRNATITITAGEDSAAASVTITVIVGTNKHETLGGTSGADMIFGLNGHDAIYGHDGNDLLCGANGEDTLNGGNGDDTLIGANGKDTFTGGAGADFFSGGNGKDAATDFDPAAGDTQDGTVENF